MGEGNARNFEGKALDLYNVITKIKNASRARINSSWSDQAFKRNPVNKQLPLSVNASARVLIAERLIWKFQVAYLV